MFLEIRFLYADLEPMTKLSIKSDPHPEGPSSLPAEVPLDIQEDLTRERQREGLKKAAVCKQLPRLTDVRIFSVISSGRVSGGKRKLINFANLGRTPYLQSPPRVYVTFSTCGKTSNHTRENTGIKCTVLSAHHEPLYGSWCVL